MSLTHDIVAFVLLLARLSGFLFGCPVLNHAQIPRMWKGGMALCLSVLLSPLVTLAPSLWVSQWEQQNLLLLTLRELALGYILAWMASLSLSVATAVGSLIDLQSGLSNASLLDPLRGEPQSLFSLLFHGMACLVFLQCDGLALLIKLMLLSFQSFPLGGGCDLHEGAKLALHLGNWWLLITVSLAMPWVLCLWALDVLTGVLGRLLPQLNLLSAAPPIKVMLSWWLLLRYFQHWLHRLLDIQSDLFRGGGL